MAKSMLEEKIEIKSEKYGTEGVILDYGMVIKLQFTHEGKDVEMGMSRPLERDDLIKRAIGCMDTYVEQLALPANGRPTKLFNWYVARNSNGKHCFLGTTRQLGMRHDHRLDRKKAALDGLLSSFLKGKEGVTIGAIS